MAIEFQREYLLRLPPPLAQLYSRAHNAKDGRSRHDNTFYLFEALIKLGAIPLVAAYLDEVERGAPRNANIDRLLAQLVLPSLGQWVGIFRELARHFGQRTDAASHPLGHLWQQIDTKRRDLPAVIALYQRIKNGPDHPPANDQTCSLLGLLDALVQYRNGVFGHGAGRFDSFYEQEMGPLLFPAANEVLRDDVLSLLGPRGTRLLYISDIRTLDEQQSELSLRELIGMQAERMDPMTVDTVSASDLLPNRVAILWPGRAVPLSLEPLLVYRENEQGEELLFLNRDRNGKQVELLSYTTGRTERDKSLAPAMAKLLTRITGRQIEEQELEQFEQQSLAEVPSVEQLFAAQTPQRRTRGDFEILAEIGHGGMGVVFLAKQLSLGRLVALKMLPADLAGDEVALARFRREMRALARCEHPNIVKVLASGVFDDGHLYYAMEFVPGADLEMVWRELSGAHHQGTAQTLGSTSWGRAVRSASQKNRSQVEKKASGDTTATNHGAKEDTKAEADKQVKASTPETSEPPAAPPLPLPPLPIIKDDPNDTRTYSQRVAVLMRDAALAVQTVHDQQIVHRDIKPANLILTSDGSRVVLMDFGLAKAQSLALTTTKAGGLLGTLRYAAPEQLAAAQLQVGPQADVHALGVTLWEMLTRQRAFGEARDENQLATWVLTKNLPLLRTVDPTLDRDLEAIVARATEREPERRIQSARQFADYLDLYLSGKPLPIRPPGTGEILWQWARQHRGLVGTAAAALALVVLTIIIAFWRIDKAKDDAILAKNDAVTAKNDAVTAKNDAVDAKNKALDAKQKEEQERRRADGERDAAIEARKEAVEAKLATETREREARQNLYLARINLAKQAWNNAKPLQVIQQLMPSVPDAGQEDLRGFEWGELFRLIRSENNRQLVGHTGSINTLAYSANGKYAASGSSDGTIKLWDGKTLELVRTIEPKIGGVGILLDEIDGKLMVAELIPGGVAAEDGRLKVGDQLVAVKMYDAALLESMGFWLEYQPGAMSGFVDQIVGEPGTFVELRVLPKGETTPKLLKLKRREVKRAGAEVNQILLSPNGELLYVLSNSQTPRIWKTADGTEVTKLNSTQAHMGSPWALSPDGKELALVSGDNTLRFFQADNGKLLRRKFLEQSRFWTFVRYRPDNSGLIAGSAQWVVALDLQGEPQAGTLGTSISLADPLALSPDGKLLVFGTQQGMLQIRDAKTNALRNALVGHQDRVSIAVFSPDGSLLATGSDDNTVRLWDLEQGKELNTLRGHSYMVRALAFSPDSKTLLSGSLDAPVMVWDVERNPEADLLTLRRGVNSLAISADGKSLAVGGGFNVSVLLPGMSDRGEAIVYNLANGDKQQVLQTLDDMVTGMDISPDGNYQAQGYGDHASPPSEIRLVNRKTGEVRSLLKSLVRPISGIKFSPDSQWLVVTLAATLKPDEPSEVRLFKVASGEQVFRYLETDGPATLPNITADGQTLVWVVSYMIGAKNGHVKLFDIASRKVRGTLSGGTGLACNYALSRQGDRIVVNNVDLHPTQIEKPSRLKLFDVATGAERFTLQGHNSRVDALEFSPEGTLLVGASGVPSQPDKGQVLVWDTVKGELAHELQEHKGKVSSLAFDNRGKVLATGGHDRRVVLWDLDKWEVKRRITDFKQPIGTVAFSPDNRVLVVATQANAGGAFGLSFRGSFSVFHSQRGRLKGFDAPSDWYTAFVFSPDSKTLLTQSLSNGVWSWDIDSGEGKPLAELRDSSKWHAQTIRAIAISPDGKQYATGSDDKSVRLWDAESGAVTQVLQGQTAAITGLQYTPDGKFLISSSGGLQLTGPPPPGQVRLWDVKNIDEGRTLVDKIPAVTALAISPDGQKLAYATMGKQGGRSAGSVAVLTRRGDTFADPFVFKEFPNGGGIQALAFTPDSKQLAVAYDQMPIVLWTLGDNEKLRVFQRPGFNGCALAFSPDGKTLAALSNGSAPELVLFQVATGEVFMSLLPKMSYSVAPKVVFSPTGDALVVGGSAQEPGQGAVQIYRALTPKEADDYIQKVREKEAERKKNAEVVP